MRADVDAEHVTGAFVELEPPGRPAQLVPALPAGRQFAHPAQPDQVVAHRVHGGPGEPGCGHEIGSGDGIVGVRHHRQHLAQVDPTDQRWGDFRRTCHCLLTSTPSTATLYIQALNIGPKFSCRTVRQLIALSNEGAPVPISPPPADTGGIQ